MAVAGPFPGRAPRRRFTDMGAGLLIAASKWRRNLLFPDRPCTGCQAISSRTTAQGDRGPVPSKQDRYASPKLLAAPWRRRGEASSSTMSVECANLAEGLPPRGPARGVPRALPCPNLSEKTTAGSAAEDRGSKAAPAPCRKTSPMSGTQRKRQRPDTKRRPQARRDRQRTVQ